VQGDLHMDRRACVVVSLSFLSAGASIASIASPFAPPAISLGYGEKTRRDLSRVARTLARHSACRASCPAPMGPISTPTSSLKLLATS